MKKPPLEKTIVNNTKTMIESRGGWCVKIHGGPMQFLGLPDIIGCYRSRFISFEVKRDPSKQPTALQTFVMKKIRRAGGIALLTFTVEQAEAALDRIDEELGGPVPDQS